MFFIPFFNVEGKHRPVLGQGWTLDYEMAFYLVLTASLFLRRSWAITAVTATFITVWLLGQVTHMHGDILQIWSSPIIFEFLLGLYLALIRDLWLTSGRSLPRVPGVAILIITLVAGRTLFLGFDASGLDQCGNRAAGSRALHIHPKYSAQ